jgi:hypothetical protein
MSRCHRRWRPRSASPSGRGDNRRNPPTRVGGVTRAQWDGIAGVADISESLAFQRVSWESRDEDIADVFDQLNRDLDLDGLIRTIWRELHTQVVVAMWWATRQYKVRGQTEAGNKRKKEYTLTAPVAMTTLDPTKVVPAGSTCLAPSSYGRPCGPCGCPAAGEAALAAAVARWWWWWWWWCGSMCMCLTKRRASCAPSRPKAARPRNDQGKIKKYVEILLDETWNDLEGRVQSAAHRPWVAHSPLPMPRPRPVPWPRVTSRPPAWGWPSSSSRR